MKTFIIIIAFLVLQSGRAVSNVQRGPDAYEGTWHYQNGNQVFVVSLWQDNEGYKGHYKLINVNSNGNQISEVYNSVKPYAGTGPIWPHVINIGIPQQGITSGVITDNTFSELGYFLRGGVKLTLLTSNNPLTAQWIVFKPEGLRPANEPEFNIPTDIVLTKVSNTINP